MARIIEVIESDTTRGNGKSFAHNEISRSVTQYFDRDGNLLWENDPSRAKALSALGFRTGDGSAISVLAAIDALLARSIAEHQLAKGTAA